MSGDAGARAPAQDEPRDLIRASIRARAVAASTVWRVPACNSSIAARRSSRRPGVASRSASASAKTQLSSGIECTTGLSVALRLSRRTTEIARPGRISARLRDDAGRLARWYSPANRRSLPPSPMTTAPPRTLGSSQRDPGEKPDGAGRLAGLSGQHGARHGPGHGGNRGGRPDRVQDLAEALRVVEERGRLADRPLVIFGPRGTSERTVTPEVPWRRTIPGLPQETPSGDGADLVDALLEDVKGVVAAGSFVPELLEFVPEPLGHFGVADERVGEPRPLAAR